MTLLSAFGIKDNPELIAFVGGGGKTSLMFALGQALPGRVVMTTTTRIFAAQMALASTVFYEADWEAHIGTAKQCLIVGQVQGQKAVGVTPTLPGQWLARPDVDFVLVEADGSRMKPIKAPADHEPVVPAETTLLVPMVGITAFNGRITDVAHRPHLVCRLTGLVEDDQLTAKAIATLLTHEEGGLKGKPEKARIIPFINQVETRQQLLAARHIAWWVLQTAVVQRPCAYWRYTNRQTSPGSSPTRNGRHFSRRASQTYGPNKTVVTLGGANGAGTNHI